MEIVFYNYASLVLGAYLFYIFFQYHNNNQKIYPTEVYTEKYKPYIFLHSNNKIILVCHRLCKIGLTYAIANFIFRVIYVTLDRRILILR